MGKEEANSTLAAAEGGSRTVEVHLHQYPALQPGANSGM